MFGEPSPHQRIMLLFFTTVVGPLRPRRRTNAAKFSLFTLRRPHSHYLGAAVGLVTGDIIMSCAVGWPFFFFSGLMPYG
jgi:hypothetical protein